jgi:peroxiredoxin
LPELQSIANERQDTDLVTVVVSGAPERAASAARKRGVTAPVIRDDGSLRKRFGVERTPTTFLIDRTGHAVKVLVGEHSRESIESAIAKAGTR